MDIHKRPVHTYICIGDKESVCLSVCAKVCKRQKKEKNCVCVTAGCWAAELKAWELTGCMPGPPSHLHHPALLFSWVAGLITDPRWHAISRTHRQTDRQTDRQTQTQTQTHTHTHTHTQTHTALPHILSFYPSLSLSFFSFLFFCHIVIFSSLSFSHSF